jgi:hypothetical protein
MAAPWFAAWSAAMISGATPVVLSLQKFMPCPFSYCAAGTRLSRPSSRPVARSTMIT